eukprot:NODE_15_length_50561_cov_0.608081.p10 type:complete len:443 gc:universal NODE_15_length_50561_cov_0.608081:35255-33927(-)
MIIAMVSDFFHPKIGGVESHIIHLSHELIKLGHTVIILTHAYENFVGIHFIGCLKVYYLALPIVYQGCVFPTILGNLPILSKIFYEEDVDLVHGHQSSSALALEACIHASLMGIHSTFTDHSLFSFRLNGPIFLNKCCKFSLRATQAFFCVSKVSRDNICLRSWVSKNDCHVIPNAIISEEFTPLASPASPEGNITIVVVSRLVYRKGTDLLINIIPKMCKKFSNINFLIAGDGEKRVELEKMIDQHILFERVTLLGAIPLGKVRDVLVQGSIFLNTSLTEAFCIAILEAASCGLLVVSTNVGGIPEVLPDEMVLLAEPNPVDLQDNLIKAIEHVINYRHLYNISCNPTFHEKLKSMYSWKSVARDTENIYKTLPTPPNIQELINLHWKNTVFGFISLMTLIGSWTFMQLYLGWLSKKAVKVSHLKYRHNEFYFENYTKTSR